ncbi:MAG: ATP-binding protein [Xenococcaceae cyanobacterium MO_207.B15]|nr:ATP-binding protein [Xenococcaceae cyanobacterium MO_207.B15]
MSEPRTAEFQIDLQGLIKLLAQNLYAESDVFVREMLQNAHDSIKRRKELESEKAPEGNVRVKIDWEAATISFIDNGAGMTEKEVQEYLSTIGRSGTEAFRQELMKKGRSADVSLIGQFGIGLLSAFIVADKIVVETRSWKSRNPAWYWQSQGDKTYTLEPGERKEPGTTVTLYINNDHRDMLNAGDLQKTIIKYADFLPIPIHLNEEQSPLNTINAPWHRDYSQNPQAKIFDLKAFLLRRFPDTPLSVIPIHISSPYPVDGVLYISDYGTLDSSIVGLVDIYQSRMFVMRANRDILPPWARFVRGIIDSPHLTLTASRDAVKQDSIQKAIRESLGTAIIEHLAQLSKKEPEQFAKICQWHHYDFKGMALQNETFFNAVDDLVPFQTNQGMMNLPAYFHQANQRGQFSSEILYFDESGSATQFIMLCEARGLLVVNASHLFESKFLERYAQIHPDIRLRQLNLEGSVLIFEPLNSDELANYRQLILELSHLLPDRRSNVRLVRFKPESIPALTILSQAAKAQQKMQRTLQDPAIPEYVQKLLEDFQDSERALPVTFYVNASNITIQQLAKMPSTDDTKKAWAAIYNNAVMLAQRVLTNKDIEGMFESSNYVISRMITQTNKVQELEQKVNILRYDIEAQKQDFQAKLGQRDYEQTEHITCFFAMPFEKSYELLLEAVRRVLEDKPYGWQVIRADEEHQGKTITANVMKHIARSHCYLAEISDNNPNVFLEVGRMSHYENRPLIYLCREDAKRQVAADLAGHIYFSYEITEPDNPDIDSLVKQLRQEFAKRKELKSLRSEGKKIYLSADVLIRQADVSEKIAPLLASKYHTVEDFLAEEHESIAQKLDITSKKGSISDAQDFLRKYFELDSDE